MPKGWLTAVERSWRFAWDYRLYPPFIIWPVTEKRREVPGEVMFGEWTVDADSRRVKPVTVREFRLGGEGWTRTLKARLGKYTIDLRSLAEELRQEEVLRFRVSANTPKGEVWHDFEYEVARLRGGSSP